jgi:hypothetical protein
VAWCRGYVQLGPATAAAAAEVDAKINATLI